MPDYDTSAEVAVSSSRPTRASRSTRLSRRNVPECKSAAAVEPVLSHFNVQTTKKSSAYR